MAEQEFDFDAFMKASGCNEESDVSVSLRKLLLVKQKKIEKEKELNERLGNYSEIYFANGQLDVINELLSYMGE